LTLNDPFGRNARRQEKRYVQFRQQLMMQGCNTNEALDAFGKRVDSMALRLALLVAAAGSLAWWLFPAAGAIALVCAAVLLAWLTSSYLQTRSLLNRLRLELRHDTQATAHNTQPQQAPPTEDSL
jgi:hypothetical protein